MLKRKVLKKVFDASLQFQMCFVAYSIKSVKYMFHVKKRILHDGSYIIEFIKHVGESFAEYFTPL